MRREDLPIFELPSGASLRDIQQQALELIVNRQSYLIERGAMVSQTLTSRALEGAGLEGLTRAMADLTGKTVVVQDKRLRPLGEAVAPAMTPVWPAVLDAISSMSQLPDGLRDRRQAAALAGWRDQSLPGGLTRLVCPIISKGMARGYLSIIGAAGDVDALDELVVEHGAAACALEMAKAKAVSEAEMSTSTGSASVGKPIAIGFGVNTARVPPNGATLALLGSEQHSCITRPCSVARRR